jgi:hypothetical protein
MHKIQLNKITADRRDFHRDTDEPGEGQEPTVQTAPVTINVAAIRCFYPRRDGRPGTRITFTDGGGFAVSESYEEVGRLTDLN